MRQHASGIGAAAAAILVLLLAGVGPRAAATGGPRLEVRPQKMDFGRIPQGGKVRKVYRLRNAGDATLIITQIRPSCTECMVDEVPVERLEPGEEADLPVTYLATAVPGTYTAHVTLHTNDPVEPLQRIYLSVEVTQRGAAPRLEVEPGQVDLGVVLVGGPASVALTLRNSGSADLTIQEVAAGPLVSVPGGFPAELPAGQSRSLTLSCLGREAGVVQTHVTIATNDPDRPTVTVPVSGYVASSEQIERLVRGIMVIPERLGTDGAPLRAARVTNRTGCAVWVGRTEGGKEASLRLDADSSVTLEVRPEDADAPHGTLVIQMALPITTDAPNPSEGSR